MSLPIEIVKTTPYNDQKPGTSGLRKPTKVFMEGNYLPNFIESIFRSVPEEELKGSTLVVSGDGRYYMVEAIHIISQIAAAHGVKRIWVGENGLLSTPAVSAVIRQRENGAAYGGIILTASHNPGGPERDFGVKFNVQNGGPSPEKVTNAIFDISKTLDSYSIVRGIPPVDLSKIGVHKYSVDKYGEFIVEVISSTEDYIKCLQSIFDFDLIKNLFQRKDFRFAFDAMYGVSGAYAETLFCKYLGLPKENLRNCTPKPDFNGWHPDPNLTYCKELVPSMGLTREGNARKDIKDEDVPDFGAATDGDSDRAMIMGKKFFVSPSDSVAVVSANCKDCIPYFKGGLKGVARSMPTSSALDLVAEKLGIKLFETPTGWKFFGNLMDSKSMGGDDYHPLICGEESFGLGSDHVREKDGLWAVMCWLSIVAYHNKDNTKPLYTVRDIVLDHWKKYGRHYYTRYDYEGLTTENANKVLDHLKEFINNFKDEVDISNGFVVNKCDSYTYNDPVDHSVSENQGLRFYFKDGSRLIFRLSGTGSSGATIRMYLEKYVKEENQLENETPTIMKPFVDAAVKFCKMEEFTGRKEPTVIT